MTTQIPNVANVPTPPSLERPKSFDDESEAFMKDWPRLFTEQNAAIDAMNLLAAELEAMETSVSGSTEIALGVLNYKGEWSSLSGALNFPASVSHGGYFYVLTSNLANVTSDEPGISAVWISPWKDHYTNEEIDALLADRLDPVIVSADQTIADKTYIVTSDATLTLPESANSDVGKTVTIKRVYGKVVTINVESSEQIRFGHRLLDSLRFDTGSMISFYFDGNNWSL